MSCEAVENEHVIQPIIWRCFARGFKVLSVEVGRWKSVVEQPANRKEVRHSVPE